MAQATGLLPVIHKVWELEVYRDRAPVLRRKTLLCEPLKNEQTVEMMMKHDRAFLGWQGVNCPRCLQAREKGMK